MKNSHDSTERILAIDPSTRGFGFVVLEGATTLLDWGVKNTPKDKRKSTLLKVADLVRLYEPTVLVLEDCFAKGSRRSGRIRELIKDTTQLAIHREVPVIHCSRKQVMEAFAQDNARTRYSVARVIVEGFPELTPCLPPPRRPWMSEDPRMRIFDAMALGLTCVNRELQ